MFGEKDLIYLATVMFGMTGHLTADEAIKAAVCTYYKVFGSVSDDTLREKYITEQQ